MSWLVTVGQLPLFPLSELSDRHVSSMLSIRFFMCSQTTSLSLLSYIPNPYTTKKILPGIKLKHQVLICCPSDAMILCATQFLFMDILRRVTKDPSEEFRCLALRYLQCFNQYNDSFTTCVISSMCVQLMNWDDGGKCITKQIVCCL